jgi:Xaa-Pro aminopeptidase
VLVTDGRYREQARQESTDAGLDLPIAISRDPWPVLADALGSAGWIGAGRIGIEAHHLTVSQRDALADAVAAELVAVPPIVDIARQHKDPQELAHLRRAAAIADAALAVCGPSIVAGGGMTERRFARDLDAAMLDGGADGLSFDTIVASGPNSARPHHRPSDRTIEPGDLVVIDFGAAVEGYGSDMTRTLVCGGAPTPEQTALYDAVAEAQAAGVAAVAEGVESVEIDRVCRSVLDRHGLADAFVHGTGHGIGLEIHEQPIVSATSVGILRADLVITVEPGAYLPGFGGVRVEDSVVVTATGCDPITLSPKGLVP